MFVELDAAPQDGKVSFEEWVSFSCGTIPVTTSQQPGNGTTMQPCATTGPNPCNPTTSTEKPRHWKDLLKVLVPLLLAWIKLHPKTTTTPATMPPSTTTQQAQAP